MEKELEEYPEEFDSKGFLNFIRERFGTPIMPEEELLIRFTRFIAPRQAENKELTEEDINSWYRSLVRELNSVERPLDTTGTDISLPHGQRRPSLDQRIEDQDRQGVSLASGLLKEKHRRTDEPKDKKRPKAPEMGDGN